MVEQLFLLLLHYHSLHVGSSYNLEPEESRRARLHDISESIVEACKARPWSGWPLRGCVALSATAAKWESGFTAEIHSGQKKGPSGELCFFQLHRGVTHIPNRLYEISLDEWKNSPGLGLDASRRCATLGIRVFGWHIYRCRIPYKQGDYSSAAILFAQYHHPSSQRQGIRARDKLVCQDVAISPMSDRRAMSYQYLLRELIQK